jgi:hypothetical protein
VDVTAYQLQMRRFAEALKPMYRFFKKEGREPEMLTQYVLLCGAICQELANIEHRLLEVATVKKYGEEAAAQACKDIEAAEREQAATEGNAA